MDTGRDEGLESDLWCCAAVGEDLEWLSSWGVDAEAPVGALC